METIEIVGEQGLGDALFFLRWAQPLAQAGARLAFRGDARLHPLLAATRLFAQLVASDAAPAPGALAVAAGDLPRLARGVAPSHPPPLALRADAALVREMRARLAALGAPPYIAVCWRAGTPSLASEHLFKHVDPARLGEALRASPATLLSVQRGPDAAEAAALEASAGRKLHDISAENDDLERMLALLEAIDDYVGVSSTNVHLRAGLGKSARILVPLPPEWRYGAQGLSSPWFAHFALYREEQAAGWGPALARLADDLGAAP
jgi:hypothetical protein